jgi:hypothetical protein
VHGLPSPDTVPVPELPVAQKPRVYPYPCYSLGSRNTNRMSATDLGCELNRAHCSIRLYYQHNTDRLSACPVTVHALLHIADSIKAMGPVWCYWAFPMERYCGALRRAVHNRRFPSASLDRFLVETSQLKQIAHVYDVANDLALRPPPGRNHDVFSDDHCMFVLIAEESLTYAIHKIRRACYCPPNPKSSLRKRTCQILRVHWPLVST